MPPEKEPEGGNKPSPEGKGLSEERVAEIVAQAISQALNPALTSHFKRFEAAIKPPEQKKAEESELQLLRRKVEELDAAKTKAETEARAQRTESRMRATLAKAGLADDSQDLALAFLERKGLVSYSDEGEPIVTLKKAKTKGGVPEPMQFTLEDGIADWLKNDAAAKPLLPAPKPAGPPAPTGGALTSGTQPAQPQQGQRKLTEHEANVLIGKAMSGDATSSE